MCFCTLGVDSPVNINDRRGTVKKVFLLCLSLLFVAVFSKSTDAVEITLENDPEILLQSLLSQGFGGSNPEFEGDVRAVGTYENDSGLWGIGPGIVLSTGNAKDYEDGINTSSSLSTDLAQSGNDALTDLSGYPTYDAATYGFDFTATRDKISFDFVFGSEEFDEFVGSMFNDAFGAWLTDSAGNKTQLSFDRDDNPITVNSAWFSGGNPPDNITGTELDGSTKLLRTEANVVDGQNYHFEFGIADASDHIYDSTVFLSNFKGTGELIDYALEGDGWDGKGRGHVDMKYNLVSGTPDLENELEIIEAALKQWEDAIDITFVKTDQVSSANSIDFYFADSLYGKEKDGPLNTLAYGWFPGDINPDPQAGDILFFEDETWLGNTEGPGYCGSEGCDLYYVAMHEIGHALGLGHILDDTHNHPEGSIMSPYFSSPDPTAMGPGFGSFDTLQPYDIGAGMTLYGASPTSAAMLSPEPVTTQVPGPPSVFVVGAGLVLTGFVGRLHRRKSS